MYLVVAAGLLLTVILAVAAGEGAGAVAMLASFGVIVLVGIPYSLTFISRAKCPSCGRSPDQRHEEGAPFRNPNGLWSLGQVEERK